MYPLTLSICLISKLLCMNPSRSKGIQLFLINYSFLSFLKSSIPKKKFLKDYSHLYIIIVAFLKNIKYERIQLIQNYLRFFPPFLRYFRFISILLKKIGSYGNLFIYYILINSTF